MAPYRRITLAVGLAMFVDAAMYLAVLPLLPHYASQFHLSKLGVAVLLAAYPAPTPFLALACIWLVPRVGGRRIALVSALVMTVATVVFAFAPNAPVLIAARFLQGVASATVWTASMAWVTHNAPPQHRGRESGIVFGMLSVGSIVGPMVGGLSAKTGPGPAFLLVALLSAVGVVLILVAPGGSTVMAEANVMGSVRAALRHPFVRGALALSLIDPAAFATIDLLVPLDLGRRGASTVLIAMAFTVGAGLGAVSGPIGGRLVDRIGASTVALAAGAAAVVIPVPFAFTLPVNGELAWLIVISPVFAVIAASLYPLASAGADDAGVAHIVVNGLLGAGWAAGFAITPLVAGVAAQHAGEPATFVGASILGLPMIWLLARSVRFQRRAMEAAR